MFLKPFILGLPLPLGLLLRCLRLRLPLWRALPPSHRHPPTSPFSFLLCFFTSILLVYSSMKSSYSLRFSKVLTIFSSSLIKSRNLFLHSVVRACRHPGQFSVCPCEHPCSRCRNLVAQPPDLSERRKRQNETIRQLDRLQVEDSQYSNKPPEIHGSTRCSTCQC